MMMMTIPTYKNKKTFTLVIIVIIVISISLSIVTIIGFTNTVYTLTNLNLQSQGSNNQCHNALNVKMFNDEIVPKYIIGKDHEIIPVDPTAPDFIVNECTLEPMGIG